MDTRLAGIFLVAAAVAACSKSSSAVVAKVGDDVITADYVKERLDETAPFLRARYNTLERKKEFVENLIRNELLAQEAVRQGFDKSPAVKEQTKRAMIQELIKHQLDEKLTGADISEDDLKKFYQTHADDFVKPEKTPAVNRSFDESKDAIRQRMARERRSRDYDEWVKKLREGTAVSINDVELDKVQADATPAQLSGQPVAAPPAQTVPPTTSKVGGN